MSDAVEAFIAHGLGARWEALPTPAQAAVKTFLLDTLGVGIAGASAAIATPVRAAAARWAGADGTAGVLGPGGWRTTPANAAFLNGFHIHCQEFDCVHEGAVVHPLATILAALLAAAADRPVSGQEFGTALAVAVDMAAGLGVAVQSPIRFFRPATAGIFGATLGVARLRGFDALRTRHALGYALSFAAGTMQAHSEGKPALPVQIGAGARGAITACDLAEAGMEGPAGVLEGRYGYFPLFEERWDLAPVLANLGHIWRIAEVSHKPFPTGRAAQGGLSLVLDLRAQGVQPGAVAALTLEAPPLIERLVGRPAIPDQSANYARLCFGWLAAVALTRGGVGLADFDAASLADPRLHALAAQVQVQVNAVTDPAAFVPQRLVARLTDGTVREVNTDRLWGSPASPLSTAENIAKFRACYTFGFGTDDTRADRLIAAVAHLETLPDASVLDRLASGSALLPGDAGNG